MIVNLHTAKTYHALTNLNDKLANALASVKFAATTKEELQRQVYKVMLQNNCVDLSVIQRIKKSKNLEAAYNVVYNLILSREGNGVLKGYSIGKAIFKGTAIRGMEVHSYGH